MSDEAKSYWYKLADDLLVNRKIVKVEWMSEEEADEVHGWHSRSVKLILDDGTVITPQADDEGNNAGALLWISPNERVKSKHFPGEEFVKTEVLPVF